jgi:hypothetical protein
MATVHFSSRETLSHIKTSRLSHTKSPHCEESAQASYDKKKQANPRSHQSTIDIQTLRPPLPLMAPYIPVRQHHDFPLAGSKRKRHNATVGQPPPPPALADTSTHHVIDPAFRTMDRLLAWELAERKKRRRYARQAAVVSAETESGTTQE